MVSRTAEAHSTTYPSKHSYCLQPDTKWGWKFCKICTYKEIEKYYQTYL